MKSAMGYELSEEELNRVFTRFKTLADSKKDLTDRDISALVQGQNSSASP